MKRTMLRIAAAAALLALLFAVLFLAVMCDHDCAGDDDCLICHALNGCRSLLENGMLLCCALCAPALLLSALFSGRGEAANGFFRTPVQLKTKLLN